MGAPSTHCPWGRTGSVPLPAPSSLSPNPVALNPAAAAPRLLSAAPKPGLNGSIHPSASARAIPAGAAGSACPSTNNPPQSIPEPGHQTPSSPSCHLPCPQQCPQGSGIPKAPGFPGENTQGEIVAKKKNTRKRGEPGRGTSLPSPPPPPQPTFPHSIPFLPEFREMEHNTPSRSRPLLPLSLLFLHPGCTGHFPPGSSSLPSSRQRLQGRKTNEKQLLGIPEG